MKTIKVDLPKFLQYIRIRFVFLSLLSIIIFNSVFGLANIAPNYHPIGSIYDSGDYGYSSAFTYLDIPSTSLTTDLTDFTYDPTTLLVIPTPRVDIQKYEFSYINKLRIKGQPMLFIGSEKIFNNYNLARNGFGTVNLVGERILDYENYGGDSPFDMEVQLTWSDEVYYAANAYGLYITEGNSVVQTMSTAMYTYCQPTEITCQSQFVISVRNQNSILLADDLMLRNRQIEKFPINTKLLQELISYNFPQVKKIVFDETHLFWAAVNKDGLSNKIREITYSPFWLIFLGIFSLLLPIIIGLKTQILSSPASGEKGILAKRIMKRFEILHTDNMISVPLTIEEKILTEEILNHTIYGVAYLSLVAKRMIRYIDSKGLKQYIPQSTYHQLLSLSNQYYPSTIGWRIIETTNMAIEDAEEKSATTLFYGEN